MPLTTASDYNDEILAYKLKLKTRAEANKAVLEARLAALVNKPAEAARLASLINIQDAYITELTPSGGIGGGLDADGLAQFAAEAESEALAAGQSTVPDLDRFSVVVGGAQWSISNLRTAEYANGDPITLITDAEEWGLAVEGAYCPIASDGDPELGYLYNWYAVSDPRGLAPSGWRVANATDWSSLVSAIGGKDSGAIKLKQTGSTWWSGELPATNETGLTFLPSGFRDPAGLPSWLAGAYIWIDNGIGDKVKTVLDDSNAIEDFAVVGFTLGASVRLVKE